MKRRFFEILLVFTGVSLPAVSFAILCYSNSDCPYGYCVGASSFSPGYCKSVPVGPGLRTNIVRSEFNNYPKWSKIEELQARVGFEYFLDLIQFITTENQHPIECSSKDLPEWLSMSGCELVGTSMRSGIFSFTVTATDHITGLGADQLIVIKVSKN